MTKEQKLALVDKIKEQVANKYKKWIIIAAAIALVLGIVLGMLSCMTGIVDPNLLTGPTPVPTAEPTPEPTPEPEYYPGDKELPIADGEVYTFDCEVDLTGAPRYVSSTDDQYMTANVSVAAARLMTPRYFEDHYGSQYKLSGTEAGVQMDIKLNSTNGAAVNFCPQDALVITVESADGTVMDGYQLMTGEISGDYGVTVTSGEAKTYYKRFTWNESKPAKYLCIAYYVNGTQKKIYFALEEDAVVADTMKSDEEIAAEAATSSVEASEGGVAPATTAAAAASTNPMASVTVNPEYAGYVLKKGGDNSKAAVKKLQERLIALGYLSGKADGGFGSDTRKAVKAAQKAWGLEETGEADGLFLTILMRDDAPKAGSATTEDTGAAAEAEESGL